MKPFLISILLLAFGLPSVGGVGLHLFLPAPPDMDRFPTIERIAPATNADFNGTPVGWPEGIYSVKSPHDLSRCFLCRFLTAPQDGTLPALLLTPPEPLVLPVPPTPISAILAFFSNIGSRAPPFFV